MTIEDRIKEMLIERGMFDNQAAAVMGMMKTNEAHESMARRWNDDIEDYPQPLLVILWISAKATALEYIDANCPQAWFRPMFISGKGESE